MIKSPHSVRAFSFLNNQQPNMATKNNAARQLLQASAPHAISSINPYRAHPTARNTTCNLKRNVTVIKVATTIAKSAAVRRWRAKR